MRTDGFQTIKSSCSFINYIWNNAYVYILVPIPRLSSSVDIMGGGLGILALARWAGWFAGQVGRQSNVEVGQMKSIHVQYSWSLYLPLLPKFKTKVLSELLNPQNSHQPSSFIILLRGRYPGVLSGHLTILVTGPVCVISQGRFEEPVRHWWILIITNLFIKSLSSSVICKLFLFVVSSYIWHAIIFKTVLFMLC